MVDGCPFTEFDVVLCHSVLETLDDPTNVISELRRVTKRGGLVGAASVDYGGLILGGQETTGPRRFYFASNFGRRRASPSRMTAEAVI